MRPALQRWRVQLPAAKFGAAATATKIAPAAAGGRALSSHAPSGPPHKPRPGSLAEWLDWEDPGTTRVGIIGYGAVGSQVAQAILQGAAGHGCSLLAVLTQNERESSPLPDGVLFTHDPEVFFDDDVQWDVLVEAAGHDAVRLHAKRCLSSGRDLLLTSVGALADQEFHMDLEETAEKHHVQVMLCSGALPACDWLSAARLGGVSKCEITQSKPPSAWIGTPAADAFELEGLSEATVVFEGPAREAAALYPKNANISCMFALCAADLDHTTVRLVADPGATANKVGVRFEGGAGNLSMEVEAAPSPINPKTSSVVPLSVVKALSNLTSPTFLGV